MARTLLTLALLVCLAPAALAQQGSRYLRDALAGPVKWQPWGQAAFDLAKRGNRPIFLSIGYASSFASFKLHEEAFSEPTIADTLNGYFVPVLVDRFERPEVAEAFELVSTAGNFVLTPDLEPFAFTTDVTNTFLATQASRWANARDAAIAEGRTNLNKARLQGELRAPSAVDATTLDAVIENIARGFDPAKASSLTLSFALRTSNKDARAIALDALRKLARDPRRDRLGGGFHRSITEHEKLLPEQALIAMAALEAWQQTREPVFEELARSTLDYAVRDLHLDQRAFYVGQDAYSLVPRKGPEEVNGIFYRWTNEELRHVAGAEVKIDETLDPAVAQKLFEHRQRRPQPFRDFTEIAGWNGLMFSALARAGAVFGEARYRDVAATAARLLTARLWNAKTRTLLRQDGVPALAEDYAMLTQGLLDLFDATYDVKWLELAKTLQQRQDELFWNASGGRYATGTTLPETLRGLLVERDDFTPSVNAVSAMNLLRLVMLTGNETWRGRPSVIFQSFGGRLRTDGASLPHLASALAASFATSKIVVVTGQLRTKEMHEFLRAVHQPFEPLRAVIFLPEKGAARNAVTAALPFTAALTYDPERPIAYVCEKGECRRQ